MVVKSILKKESYGREWRVVVNPTLGCPGKYLSWDFFTLWHVKIDQESMVVGKATEYHEEYYLPIHVAQKV